MESAVMVVAAIAVLVALPLIAMLLLVKGTPMTTDTETDEGVRCRCGRRFADADDQSGWRWYRIEDGGRGALCPRCYADMSVDGLRGMSWLPRQPSTEQHQPARKPKRKRADIDISDMLACGLCGVKVRGDTNSVGFRIGRTTVLARECPNCYGGVSVRGLDTLALVAEKRGKNIEGLDELDMFVGVVNFHRRHGLDDPPPAPAPWEF